jgi:hypothetical protein
VPQGKNLSVSVTHILQIPKTSSPLINFSPSPLEFGGYIGERDVDAFNPLPDSKRGRILTPGILPLLPFTSPPTS